MTEKFEILEIHETDCLNGNGLIGKVGIGDLEEHPIYPDYSQGRLDLSFKRKVASKVLHTTKEGVRKTVDGPDKYVQSTECLYFSAVKVKKVGN